MVRFKKRTAMNVRKALNVAFFASLLLTGGGIRGTEDAVAPQGGFGIATPSVEELAIPQDKSSEKSADVTTREAMCLMIEAAARAHDLPLEFFARVIWQESRFQPNAVGPMTRSGKRAQGIAQFMPGTAAERRLLDPFDPVQALPKSAEFLAKLRGKFGNLGLAAAAYNAGPQRVRDWLAGKRDLPGQTRAYVRAITDRSAEDWAHGDTQSPAQSSPNCQAIVATLKRDGGRFIASLEQHVTIANAQPWGAQLSAGFSRERALGDYARIMQRLGAAIGERDPMITSAVMRSRGTSPFYQVRIGAQTRQEADDLCKQIHRAGTACVVWRTAKAGRSAVAQSSGSSLTIEAP